MDDNFDTLEPISLDYLLDWSSLRSRSLIKDSCKPNNEVNNLRPVAVTDSLANIFEAILLNEVEKDYKDHPKQFGFKECSSCQHAIFILKQAIKISRLLKKRLYMCSIDASKAFDKVNRLNLCAKLIQNNFNPEITMVIMKYYKNSLMLVKNDTDFSYFLPIKLGVKQVGKSLVIKL
ncbi:unnamed protein product [Brachionus calyciflorus]|uniref:Reverse transcriptase domain-containing protein n=1 Tax=Brachionus calyciflorus TaxID=104777 RepID=A0A813QTQ0_9BILA|nr:unnamed protein product [Brachionus calyciflorus]